MSLRASLAPSAASPFTFDAYLPLLDTHDNGKNTADALSLPSPPTSWLSAKDMRIFGETPLTATVDIGIVRCKDCRKPILKSIIIEHAENCTRIRLGPHKKSSKGKYEEGKKRKLEDGEDGPPNKKARPAPKITKGRVKGPVDYDKQCGVINDKGLPCSRSLTCKSHSMGAKRAVQGRTRLYDDLLLDWNRAHNPNFVEPVKRETKAEKKEKRDREREEKRKAKELASELKRGQPKISKTATKKKVKDGKGILVPTANEEQEEDDDVEAEEDADSETEMEVLIRAIRSADQKGFTGVPLATMDETTFRAFFPVRRERLRDCRDLLSGAFGRRILSSTMVTVKNHGFFRHTVEP